MRERGGGADVAHGESMAWDQRLPLDYGILGIREVYGDVQCAVKEQDDAGDEEEAAW